MKRKPLQDSPLQVDISDIDLSPGPFCMSFNFDLEPLKASIEGFGVLNPPYLLRNSDTDTHFTVVAGYRRLLAVRELGWPDIVCQVLPDGFPPFKALLLNLHDNLVHRHLNNVEKGMVVQRLTRFVKHEQIITQFMPMLDIPANRQTLRLFLGLEDLEEPIKASIAVERLSLRVAGLMMSLGTEDRLKINELFIALKWSFNQQWEAIQWITEIASREGRSIEEVINDREVTEILHDSRMSNPQKLKDIVKALKRRRFPSLMKAETEFRKGISALPLPKGVKISPPPFFEGTDYRVEIVFTKGKDLRDRLEKLSHLSGLGKITDFWRGPECR
ncbi:MAG: ParB N-terminal domain-containing protein [Deltaproteobacteria bacterium]|nr:MAG: ParB N-terminal domain-containing protein [Deltaproteobacteria bacterium]